MQYTYTVVEAAALWAGLDVAMIARRIQANDEEKAEEKRCEVIERNRIADARAEAEWREMSQTCCLCKYQLDCPDWDYIRTEDGDQRQVLRCPEQYCNPPGETPPHPTPIPEKRTPINRALPLHGEFSDLPEFEKRLSWLQQALTMNDLAGSTESIRASDLREWIPKQFPNEHPAFLFSDMTGLQEQLDRVTAERDALLAELAKVRKQQEKEGKWTPTTYLNIIGTLLAVLRTRHKYGSDESIYRAMWDFFGGEKACPRGLGDTTLEGVFSTAKQKIREADAEKWAIAFPRSPDKS